MTNLWPSIGEIAKVPTPSNILSEQGVFLADSTHGKVEGIVEKIRDKIYLEQEDIIRLKKYKFEFIYRFYIYSSILSYRTPLFWIVHDIDLYPVAIIWENGPKEIKETASKKIPTSTIFAAPNEKAYLMALKRIFSDKTTTKVITAILSQI